MRITSMTTRQIFITALFASLLIVAASADPPSKQWLTDYNAALKAAQNQSKPLLIMFSASWCPPCQMMKRDVLPQQAVQQQLGKWALAYIDIDENKKVPGDFAVEVIPTFVMLDSAGRELGRFNAMQAAEFAAWIGSFHDNFAALDQLERQLKAAPKDAALLGRKADILVDIALTIPDLSSRAMVVTPTRLNDTIDAYKQAQSAGAKNPALQSDIDLLGAIAQAIRGDFAGAEPKLALYQKQNPNGKFAGDALFWQAVVAAQQKQADRTKSLIQQYNQRFPNGRYKKLIGAES